MTLIACTTCGELLEIRDLAGHVDRHRPNASERGYGAAWQRIRAAHLAIEPDCRSCGEPATDVDHIVRKRDGGSDDDDNLRSLCHACHSRRTSLDRWADAREET
jgi:5-methylcytosine-specific restriction endonuclease McrA